MRIAVLISESSVQYVLVDKLYKVVDKVSVPGVGGPGFGWIDLADFLRSS